VAVENRDLEHLVSYYTKVPFKVRDLVAGDYEPLADLALGCRFHIPSDEQTRPKSLRG